MNAPILRRPLSVNARCWIILGIALAGYLMALLPNLPGACEAVADVLGLR